MELTLSAFRALLQNGVGDVVAVAGRDGFTVTVAGGVLFSDSRRPRRFANLTTAARFAKQEGAKSMRVDLGQMPVRRRVAAKPRVVKPKPKAAKAAA